MLLSRRGGNRTQKHDNKKHVLITKADIQQNQETGRQTKQGARLYQSAGSKNPKANKAGKTGGRQDGLTRTRQGV